MSQTLSNFKYLAKKLQPIQAPNDYVTDNYSVEELISDVSTKSLMLSHKDIEKIVSIESNYGKKLKNPSSSAKGIFQILDNTRKELLKQLKTSKLVKIPSNPIRQDAFLMQNLIIKSEKVLKSRSKIPNLHNIYLIHHYGIQGALDILNSPNKHNSKKKLHNIRILLSKPLLTTINDGKPAKDLLELLEEP